MNRVLSFVAVVGSLGAGVLTISPAPAWAHCIRRPGPVADSLPETLALLNGRVVDSIPRPSPVQRSEIELMEVVCWDKAERMFGVRVSIAVVSVWTRPGPYALLQQDLQRLVEAEQSHHNRHAVYTGLGTLDGFTASPSITLTVTVGPGGFVAQGFHDQLDYLCYVYYGSARVPLADMTQGEPLCESQHGRGPWGMGR